MIEKKFDVFLSYSPADKAVALDIARILRKDGLRVWFDEWEIDPGRNSADQIAGGLKNSRVLVLCMSANAFGNDWAALEFGVLEFGSSLDEDRRFVPLRLDNAPIKDSLVQYKYISWLPHERLQGYAQLQQACRPVPSKKSEEDLIAAGFEKKILSLEHTAAIQAVAFSPDGNHAITGASDNTVRLWHIESGQCIRVMEGHTYSVNCVAWSPDGTLVLTGSSDKTVRLWQVASGECIRVMEGHTYYVNSVAFNPDGTLALTGSSDNTVRLWKIGTGQCIRVMKDHTLGVFSVAWSPDGNYALSGSYDKTVRLWLVRSGRCTQVMTGHTEGVFCVAFSPDGSLALSGSEDKTVRIWQVKSGSCVRIMEGHTEGVMSLAFSPDGSCAITGSADNTVRLWQVDSGNCIRTMKGHSGIVLSVAFSPDGTHVLTGADEQTIRLWQVETGKCIRMMEGRTEEVLSVAWSPDRTHVLTGAADNMLRLWEVKTGLCIRVMEGNPVSALSVAFSPKGKHALTGSSNNTVRLWEVESGQCIRVMEGHINSVWSVAFSPDGTFAITGSSDNTVRLWEVGSGQCIHVMEGHTDTVWSVAFSPDGTFALTGSSDNSVRLWHVSSGQCIGVMEGHTGSVWSVAFSPDGMQALSGSADNTVRLWQVASGQCIRVMEGHADGVLSVAWSPDGCYALTGSYDMTVHLWQVATGNCIGVMAGHHETVRSMAWMKNNYIAWSTGKNGVSLLWDLSELINRDQQTNIQIPDQLQYTNAKVLLVGDSGVGKTGLFNYLALGIKDMEKYPSTDGAWATHWKLPHGLNKDGMNREVWLWDFAGQVDYRLVHQLFMDETAAAVLVFNPQQENPFEGLGQWDKDLQKATRHSFARILAAGRVDRGPMIASDSSIQKFMQERGFFGPLHLTSAKTGEGCDELRDTITKAINWNNVPTTTTPTLYHRMKREILLLRDKGIVVITLAELKQRMDMALSGEVFSLDELQSVIGLLTGPGMIRRLDFGNLILLKPEILSRYAAALIRKVRKHPKELGCIDENDLLSGRLNYQDFERLPPEEELVLLRALHETVVNRAWCFRLMENDVTLLTFPSYYRRERPDQPHHPNALVTYRFSGPIDDIYATLIVRLHHTVAFEADQLWRNATDFKTQAGQGLGLKLVREPEGKARIEIYFNHDVDVNSRLVFERYVHNHLKRYDDSLKRLRHYYCPNKKCDAHHQPFENQSTIDKALMPGRKGKVYCPECGKEILLKDIMEEKFESLEIRENTRKEEVESQIKIDNESLELILVGHVYSIVAAAGQIYRSFTNSDHGIDGEIEFKDDEGHATGRRLYIQLKSGDSYLTNRKRDETEVFQIKKARWAQYWQKQAYPVMLVIRNSKGEIRWMNVSEYLTRTNNNTSKPVTQIIFKGEKFDVMSIRRWRDRL